MNIDVKKRRQQRINQLNATQQSWQNWREAPPSNHFIYKCVISLIVYAVIWTVFQLEHTYALKTQIMIKDAMNDSFDYEALTAWYQEHIGTIPSLLPAYDKRIGDPIETVFASPVSGRLIQNDIDESGVIQISTLADHTVTTIGRGLVQFVGPSNNDGMTVKVLHVDGIEAIYAGLESVQIQKNDWLEEGDLIGHATVLYFALKRGDQYVNPEDVIAFD